MDSTQVCTWHLDVAQGGRRWGQSRTMSYRELAEQLSQEQELCLRSSASSLLPMAQHASCCCPAWVTYLGDL